MAGRREPINIHDLGDQNRGRGLADARDRDHIEMGRGGQISSKAVVSNFLKFFLPSWQFRTCATRSRTKASTTGPRSVATDSRAARCRA